MKFTVGYQLPRDRTMTVPEVLRAFAPHIAEVYFAWPGEPGGRAPLPDESREQIERDLVALRQLGVRLGLLFNASCYGAEAFSRTLARHVLEVITHLEKLVGIDSVTTMSPMIARLIKNEFPHIAVRASVNMRIGTRQAMECVAGLFDSFVIQRDYNRDFERLAELRQWCDGHGKQIQLLANSGCMPFCAVQTFHDNLVAHESEVDVEDCIAPEIPGSCWSYYRSSDHWPRMLRGTWIRPEDVDRYEPFADELKLATRMHAHLHRVVRAYVDRRYAGNLLDLLEPSHARLLAPKVIDNTRFPNDWLDRISDPSASESDRDAYADAVFAQVMVDTSSSDRSPHGAARPAQAE